MRLTFRPGPGGPSLALKRVFFWGPRGEQDNCEQLSCE